MTRERTCRALVRDDRATAPALGRMSDPLVPLNSGATYHERALHSLMGFVV